MGPKSITASNASRVSSLLHSFPCTASGSGHVVPPSPFEKPQMQSAASTANAHGPVPQPSPSRASQQNLMSAQSPLQKPVAAGKEVLAATWQQSRVISMTARSHGVTAATWQQSRVISMTARSHGVTAATWPASRLIVTAAKQQMSEECTALSTVSNWEKTGMYPSHGPGGHGSHDEAEHGHGGCSHELLLLQLMQRVGQSRYHYGSVLANR